ncbi:membrane protein insertion efficiency factor YidD [Candidatus Uhrbacteria bacterium]|nr:membrane protein insertion efficiency factor YidD [Candidatus Uhrbacteria bacterium]
MKKYIIFFIRIYQKTLSPDHGLMRFFYPYGLCKWYPSCSQYACDALRHTRVWRGIYAAIKRVMRCHPWSMGGIDFFSEKK